MANKVKRTKLDDELCVNNEKDSKLNAFLKWLNEEGVEISEKVRMSKTGSCAQYGLLATMDIAEGERLFKIPRSTVLWLRNSGIKDLIEKEKEMLKNESGWVPLLIVLMHECTTPNSRWKPYLEFVPDYSQLDHPMFWDRDDMVRELQGTGIIQEIDKDLQKMKQEFDRVVLPFLKKHPTYFGTVADSFEFYKKMVAFVMAYSFTDPANTALQKDEDSKQENVWIAGGFSPPLMVPLADALNHVAKNNAHLNFRRDYLEMCSVRCIKKGEEIFNTYGELSNAELLHMYGFAEPYPNNHNDTVEIPMDTLLNEYKKEVDQKEMALLDDKLRFLRDMELMSDGCQIVIGHEGVLTEEELYHTLKVLHMDESIFQEHKKKDGWSDDDDDEDDAEDMSNKAIGALPESWKGLLRSTIKSHLLAYQGTSSEDCYQEIVNSPIPLTTTERRKRWAFYVRYGQKKLLENFLKLLD